MDLYLFLWALSLMLGIDGGATEKCPTSKGTSFNLSVASRRNLTGHWIISVDGVREDPQHTSPANTNLGVAIDVGHLTASCEGTDMVRLTAMAVVDAAAAVHEVTEMVTTSGDHMTTTTSDEPPNLTETTSQAPPLAGYEMVNGLGYYKMHINALTWEEARNKCVQEGSRLIIINSDEEAAVVKTIYTRDQPKIPKIYDNSGAWVGFDDIVTENKYTTVLGEPLSSSGYTRWYNTDRHNNREYNCGMVSPNALLNVYKCDHKLAFICEFSA